MQEGGDLEDRLDRPVGKNAEFRLEGRELNIALNEELLLHLRSKYTAVEIFWSYLYSQPGGRYFDCR